VVAGRGSSAFPMLDTAPHGAVFTGSYKNTLSDLWRARQIVLPASPFCAVGTLSGPTPIGAARQSGGLLAKLSPPHELNAAATTTNTATGASSGFILR